MDKHRLVMIGLGLAMVAVVGLGYVIGIQPQLSAAAAANAQTTSIAAANQAAERRLAKLEKDYARVDDFTDTLAELQRSIPPTASLDVLLADLRALAASTGTTVSQFTPGEAVAYAPPAAPAEPRAPQPRTNPLITSQNFVAIPVTIGVEGTTDAAIAFLGGLQKGARLVLVTGFAGSETDAAAAGTAAAGAATYTITGFVYVLDVGAEGATAR